MEVFKCFGSVGVARRCEASIDTCSVAKNKPGMPGYRYMDLWKRRTLGTPKIEPTQFRQCLFQYCRRWGLTKKSHVKPDSRGWCARSAVWRPVEPVSLAGSGRFHGSQLQATAGVVAKARVGCHGCPKSCWAGGLLQQACARLDHDRRGQGPLQATERAEHPR